jgi:prepilin-type N-terminal cleavage/methylation domain-containing protein
MKREKGHSLVEVLIVLALLAITATISSVAWSRYLSRTATMQAARVVRSAMSEARMLAVYHGLNHFVVFDPSERTVSIHQDSSVPFGEFDDGDPRVGGEHWPESVHVAFPPSVTGLSNPLDGGALNDAWTIPSAVGEAWRGGLHGVLATPSGAISSADLEPEVIRAGVIVFTDDSGRTVSLGIRGQFGNFQWFKLTGTTWITG